MIFGLMSVKFYAIFPIFICLTCTNGYICKPGTDYVENLRCRLFANYSSSISANTSQNYLQILDLGIFYADVDVSGILQLIGDATATWQDDQLTWKPNKDHIIESLDIRKHFDEIWKPDFILINNAFRENKSLLGSGDFSITVIHNGTVTFWTKYTSIQANCPIKIERRPWFDHTCPLRFKTSSSNFIFTTHNESAGLSSTQSSGNSNDVNWRIESPWSVNETRRVELTDGNNTSTNDSILIEVELHRNIGPYESTKCISYPKSYEDALRCYLQTNFDLLSPPPEANPPPNTTTDYLSLITFMSISYIDFNIEDGILLLVGHFSMHWDDERVMDWDLNKFGHLSLVKFEPNSVWKPNLTFNNHLFQNSAFKKEPFAWNQLVQASWFGYFRWITSMNLYTRCDTNSSSWPWSAHKCSLNFTLNSRAMNPRVLLPNEKLEEESLWEITYMEKHLDFPNFNVEITFEMKSRSLKVVSILTFIAVSLITLLSFWISPMSSIKLASKISSLLLLVLYLVMLVNSIPHFSTIASHFLIAFVMLILTVGISSCVTAYVTRLARKSRSYHPSLIMKSTEETKSLDDAVKETPPEDIALTDEEYTSEDSLSKKSQNEWLKIALLVEYSSFSICLILAILLTISLMI